MINTAQATVRHRGKMTTGEINLNESNHKPGSGPKQEKARPKFERAFHFMFKENYYSSKML
jgi:hypothetical protein